MAGKRISQVLVNLLLLLFSLSCLFPIIWIFMASMKTQPEFMLSSMALPKSLNLRNYAEVFQKTRMGLYMLNSARNTLLATACIILISFMAAYALSRFRFRGRNLIYNYFILGMVIPLHALLVPMYIQFHRANLDNHWFTLLFPYVAFGLPISIMLISSYIESVPGELEDAAAIDGCGFFQKMFLITFPLTRPVLSTVAIIQFFSCWNEFSFALILLNNDALRTVPVGLNAFKGAHDINYPRLMAAILISMIPVMLLYFSFSRKIIDGMVAGAVKG